MLNGLRRCDFCKKWVTPIIGPSTYFPPGITEVPDYCRDVPLCSDCGLDLIWAPLVKSKAAPAFIEGSLRAGESSPEIDIPPGYVAYVFRVRMPKTGRVVLMEAVSDGWTYGIAHTHDSDKLWDRQHGRAERLRLDCVSAAEPIDYYFSYVRPDPMTKGLDWPGARGMREAQRRRDD